MPPDATEHHLTVSRTARYYTLGDLEAAREVWFVLHGYGQLAQYFARPFETIAGANRAVIVPEALSRFYVDGLREHKRVGASWMTRADRLHEIDDYVRYLDDVYERVMRHVPGEVRCCVLGFSQGTATACRWVACGEVAAGRLLLWAGGIPPDLDLDAYGTRFQQLDLTLVVGTDDAYIPEARVEEETSRLTRHGIPHRTIRFEGGHRIDPDVLRRVV